MEHVFGLVGGNLLGVYSHETVTAPGKNNRYTVELAVLGADEHRYKVNLVETCADMRMLHFGMENQIVAVRAIDLAQLTLVEAQTQLNNLLVDDPLSEAAVRYRLSNSRWFFALEALSGCVVQAFCQDIQCNVVVEGDCFSVVRYAGW